MTPAELEALRTMSRVIFGQTYRLEVMLCVADTEDGLVTQTDLARALSLSVSNVQGPVRSLVGSGLLSEMPRGDGRSRFFLRNRSAAWDWAREIRARVHASDVASRTDKN